MMNIILTPREYDWEVTIKMYPTDFTFSRFGGFDEVKTTINEDSLEVINNIRTNILLFENKEKYKRRLPIKFKVILNWKYFELDQWDTGRLYHLMTMSQVMNILDRRLPRMRKGSKVSYTIRAPYLFGAQQDKRLVNQNQVIETYLLNNPNLENYQTVMPHSLVPFKTNPRLNDTLTPTQKWIDYTYQNHLFNGLPGAAGAEGGQEETLVVFPDKSAKRRYSGKLFRNYIILGKERDVETGVLKDGQLEVIKLFMKDPIEHIKRITMVDDMIMAGGTFKLALKTLREMFTELPITTYNKIVVPHITKEVYHKVFMEPQTVYELHEAGAKKASFHEIVALDYNYKLKIKVGGVNRLTLVPWEVIYDDTY